ncbi:MAG: peptide chain release factor N(5)-glutamine methyltransferase [Actinomycetota bacterium]
MTIRALLHDAIGRLQAAGVDTPRLDGELLLAHVLQRDRTFLFAHPEDVPSPDVAARYGALVGRRVVREPLPYLLGTWEFMGLPFHVSPGVLIPRPETETLVETVAARLQRDAQILDVGAGSGCISVGLARLLPHAEILALEPSPEALEVARRNVYDLGFAGRVQVLSGRFPEDAAGLRGLDAVVSNPPYIPSAEVDELEPELRFHEPRGALDGGPDGLEVLRPLVQVGPDLLKAGGLLAVEVAMGQAEGVCDLLEADGRWRSIETVADLAGIARVVLARVR